MHLPACGSDEERIGILVAVPEPWSSEITTMRTRLGDRHGSVTPAHITLLPPTTIKKSDRERVMEHLQQVASTHPPFKVSLEGAGSFRPLSPVVFLNVKRGYADLVSLEEEVRSNVLDMPTRFPYHPHVTIAHKVSEENLDLAQTQSEQFHAEWFVTGFRLDHVDDDGSYRSQALFNFNSSVK